MAGNARWVDGELDHPDRDPERRQLVSGAQDPYGVVLSCIDSRVAPELVFDTGLDDLYVLRTGEKPGADPVDTMIHHQIRITADELRANADLAPLVKKGALAVVGAYYSLDTGKVDVLTGAPA
ncbi:carbonic anhydrase [Streptomyces sp. NPDC041003]